jgi:hypothetical protein
MRDYQRFRLFAKRSFCHYYLARQIYLYTQGLSTIWILKSILMSPDSQPIFLAQSANGPSYRRRDFEIVSPSGFARK